jgi:hypothetical protein
MLLPLPIELLHFLIEDLGITPAPKGTRGVVLDAIGTLKALHETTVRSEIGGAGAIVNRVEA